MPNVFQIFIFKKSIFMCLFQLKPIFFLVVMTTEKSDDKIAIFEQTAFQMAQTGATKLKNNMPKFWICHILVDF